MKPLLKICGMKYNIAEVAKLQPDYLGFIFYEKSPRFFDGEEIPSLPQGIKKVGIFVDETVDKILSKVYTHNLDVIQLHGEESEAFCDNLKVGLDCARPDKPYGFEIHVLSAVEVPVLSAVEVPVLSAVEVWKVFSIEDEFDFEILKPFEKVVDKFLFDTKGKQKGGNGFTFNWEILKIYPSKKPFILSGGIGMEEIDALKELLKTDLPIHAIDVNSKFETEPGMKDVSALASFIENMKQE